MIDEVRVESDERGFELVLIGDFTESVRTYEDADDGCLRLRLPQDAAIQLLAQARSEIGPWFDVMEFERAAYARASTRERAVVLGRADRRDDETLVEAADLFRKRARENSE